MLSTGFGIMLIALPALEYRDICLVFVLLLALTGTLELIFAIIACRRLTYWAWFLTKGLMDTLFALYLTRLPEHDILCLPLAVGFYIFFNGLLHGGLASELITRPLGRCAVLLLGLAALTLLFAASVLISADFAGIATIMWVASGLTAIGVYQIVLAIQRVSNTEPTAF